MADSNQMFNIFYFLVAILKLVTSHSIIFLGVGLWLLSGASAGIMYDFNNGAAPTREIEIKQGKLRGMVVKPTSYPELKPVEVFLGIPYAAAPTGSQRFMPPGSPPQWMGIREAHTFGPVCPQNLPDLNEKKRNTMSEGRANYLRRLFPYLLYNQSEDCLYLNIYAPAQRRAMGRSSPKYPVIVFIHGESFEWNSGNPYDGSVLASYGEVLVVTFNFRLGILGFLRPGVGEHTLSNFGLLDQIAALQWVKDNIHEFGGDAGSVTLMGHGTGAACVNYLMVSPVSQGTLDSGLFHRAILMSGTALADWALTTSSVYTIQVAQALNCPLKETNEMATCLRKRRLDEIMEVKVEAPEFKTRFGPMVDGSVVPNEPFHLTGVYKELFGRYELLYGVTELESYNLLDAVSLEYGMLEQDRDKKIRTYVQERFEYLPDLSLAETLKAYNVTRRRSSSPSQSVAEIHRDILLDVLSDARVAAPMVQTANFHSSANPKSYFYVFSHRSVYGDYAGIKIDKSVHGEELPYVFGVPIDNGKFPSHRHFNEAERFLSEAVMAFWTNFAKTGNPNAPRTERFVVKNEMDWPEYDIVNQAYLSLGIPPKIGHHYRQKILEFWYNYQPDLKYEPDFSFHADGCSFSNATLEETDDVQSPSLAKSVVIVIGICLLLVNLFAFAGLCYQRDRLRAQERIMKRLYAGLGHTSNQVIYIKHRSNRGEAIEATVKKNNAKLHVKHNGEGIYETLKTRDKTGEARDEDVDGDEVEESTWRLSRQCSVSTMDTHTKVKEWIENELIQKSVTKVVTPQECPVQTHNSVAKKKNSCKICEIKPPVPTPRAMVPVVHQGINTIYPSTSKATTKTISIEKVKKVSIAVDATPTARIASLLSKPMEGAGGENCISTSELIFDKKIPPLKRSESSRLNSSKHSSESNTEHSPKNYTIPKSISSIDLLKNLPRPKKRTNDLTFEHHHSNSDPVPETTPFETNVKPSRSKAIRHSHDRKGKISTPKSAKELLNKQMTEGTGQMKIKMHVPKKDIGITASFPITPPNKNLSRDTLDKNVPISGPLKNPKATGELVLGKGKVSNFQKEEYEKELALIHALATKRHSLPPPLNNTEINTPNLHEKEIQSKTRDRKLGLLQRRKGPSTLGRKVSNTTPLLPTQLESLQESIEATPSVSNTDRQSAMIPVHQDQHKTLPNTQSGTPLEKKAKFSKLPLKNLQPRPQFRKTVQTRMTDASTETSPFRLPLLHAYRGPMKESVGTSTSSLMRSEETGSNTGTVRQITNGMGGRKLGDSKESISQDKS